MINTTIKNLKGVGEKKAKLFAKLGVHTLFELIENYPKRYDDRTVLSEIKDITFGSSFTFLAKVRSVESTRTARGKQLIKFRLYDNTGELDAIYINAGYMKNMLKKDVLYYFHGSLADGGGKKTIFHPEFLKFDENPDGFGVRSVYGLTKGLTSSDFTKLITQVQNVIAQLENKLPSTIISKYNFMNRSDAILELHLPTSSEKLKIAQKTLIYEEIFFHQFILLSSKEMIERKEKNFSYQKVELSEIESKFPFDFTSAQKKVIADIFNDMYSSKTMNRLIHGDVGSGKTAIAIAATYLAAKSGYQVAVMSPTEILASQHYESFSGLIGQDFNIKLLSSNVKNKKALLEEIASGEVDIIIGTHAIIQKNVQYNNLKLIITDEQHRFGVKQRTVLKEREDGNVDTLVMSATPIPRTLSMIVYGDLDISKVDVMPNGRQKIYTRYVKKNEKSKMINFCKERIDLGEKVYFVAPLIEDSEKSELVSLDNLYNTLKDEFAGYEVAKLHGKMSDEEKDEIINQFKSGAVKVLVSTTVIEVGVDVPEATIIVITHVERFGLSQLHQLRGRVGRSSLQSYCFLTAGKLSEKVAQRIKAMINNSSGFEIAEIDLKLRGAGDILGTRQHGFAEFKIADFTRDYQLIQTAREDAAKIIKELSNQKLEQEIKRVLNDLKY